MKSGGDGAVFFADGRAISGFPGTEWTHLNQCYSRMPEKEGKPRKVRGEKSENFKNFFDFSAENPLSTGTLSCIIRLLSVQG